VIDAPIEPEAPQRAGRRHRRSPWVALLLVVALAITLAGIFPFRQMIAQQRQVENTEADLAALSGANDALEADIRALHSDAEVERLARERGLVRPGEVGYSMSFDEEPVPVADSGQLEPVDDRSLLGRFWDFLTGRDLDPDT
jgi:cell division protein FtsB